MSEEEPTKLMKAKMIPNWVVTIFLMVFYAIGFLYRGIYQ